MSRTNEMYGDAGVRNELFGNCSASTAKITATSVCPASFCLLRRPRLRCLEILMKSSRKPTRPSPAMRNSTSTPLTVGGVQGEQVRRRRTPRASAPMMTAPPMVGVPRLVWCEVGPSSRMNWP